jgi:hypothetical protein
MWYSFQNSDKPRLIFPTILVRMKKNGSRNILSPVLCADSDIFRTNKQPVTFFFAISLVSRHCITKHTPVTKMVAVHLQTGASKQMAATRLLREKVERAMGGGGCKRTVHVLHASLGMSSLWPQRQYSWGINLVRPIPPQNIFTYQQIKIMETGLQRALVLL